MTKNDSVVAICPGDDKAWQAVRKLQQSGFDIHKLSVVGNNAPAGVDRPGDYNAGDRIKKRGIPSGATFFSIPGIGPIAVGGPLASAIAQGQEVSAAEAEFSALGAGLRRCGIPRDNVSHYETAVKSDNYLVILHCAPDEVIRAKEIFDPLQVTDLAVHHA
jgi:hypothetical protein